MLCEGRDRQLYQQLRQAVAERGRIALATVVAPAQGQSDLLGRKLLITGSGIFGDLGDAALTSRMRQQAPEFLLQRGAQLLEIDGAVDGRRFRGTASSGCPPAGSGRWTYRPTAGGDRLPAGVRDHGD